MSLSFKEGDRVQYKIDLSKEAVSEGTIQKVLKGGESVRESSVERLNIVPRYVSIIEYWIHYLMVIDYRG